MRKIIVFKDESSIFLNLDFVCIVLYNYVQIKNIVFILFLIRSLLVLPLLLYGRNIYLADMILPKDTHSPIENKILK